MNPGPLPDYYERLHVSPRADGDTIERVFRHIAKRLHPDNPESGDADRFAALLEAFRVLSDPERRAQYDVQYEAASRERWRVYGPAVEGTSAAADRSFQFGLLSILYKARRNDAVRPGVGIVDMERLLDCPENHMTFHLWYLKERGLISRQDNGTYAITAAGVDRVLEREVATSGGLQLLKPSPEASDPSTTAAG
jgi:curved DNA-binding protein CbpA